MASDKEITPVTREFIGDVRRIIDGGRKQAYAAAGNIALATYWKIGQRIVEEEQKGKSRADYGKRLIDSLADKLSVIYGTNYSKRNLQHYVFP